jgi:Rrf2 family protein
MNNVRFATAIHILSLMHHYPEDWLSSEFIADSVNVNAAIIRKELITLRAAGLIQSKEGKGGGSALAMPAKKIRLSDIYSAVNNSVSVLGRTNSTNPENKIGKKISKQITALYTEVDEAFLKMLGKKTLQQFVES